MRNFEKTKKLLSFLLAAVMVLSYVPVRALAEEECPHHTCGTDCSFVEAVAGVACSHQCSEACTEEVTNCVHEHSEEEGCVFTPAAEKVDCDHDCASGDCSYVAAQEAVLCTCGAVPQHTAECAAMATEGAECDCDMPVTHTEECTPKEAVAGVPCNHVHGQCAYKEAVEESWACTHVCSKDNGCITEKCTHVCPADNCGFVEAVEGVPCDYVCQLCAEQNKPVCTADENCEAEEHAENCPMAICADCEQLNKDCICCEHCDGIGEAHSENCPKAVCPHCGNLNEAHSETCSTRCTNAEGCIDDKHGKDCPLYLCEVCGEKPCVCGTPKLTDTGDGCGYFGCNKTGESHLFLLHESGSTALHEIQQNCGFGFGGTIWFYDAAVDMNTQLNHTDVSFPDFVSYRPTILTLDKPGEGAITYGDYQLTVISLMPDVGLFSESNRTPEKMVSFIGGKQGDQKTFYLMWSDSLVPATVEVTADGKPVKVISPTPKEGTTNVIVLSEGDVTAKYIEVTIELPVYNRITFTVLNSSNESLGSYQVEKTLEENQGGQGGSEETGTHTCDVEGPHLFLKDKDKNKYYHDLRLTLGSGQRCHAYFCNAEGTDIPLSFEDLEFPDFLSPIFTVDVSGIEAIGVGEGVITYTDETNDITYELSVVASLPKYGFYTDAVRNAENFTAETKGNAGDKNTRYLMWDTENPNCTPVDSIAAETDGNVPLEDCTYEKGTNYLKIEYTIPDAPWIRFNLFDAENKLIDIVVLQRGIIDNTDDEIPIILNIKDKKDTITVGIGAAMGPQGETMVLNEKGGVSYKQGDNGTEGGMDVTLCLAALSNYGVAGEEQVAEKFIADVMASESIKFEIVSWENSSHNDADRPSLTVYEGTAANVPTMFVRIQAEPKKFGNGYLVMSFTYDGKEYKTTRYISYKDTNVSIDVSEQTDLNSIFSSGDAFFTWLNEELAKKGDKYDGTGFVDLYLPQKNYEEVIEIDLSFENPQAGKINAVRLYGHKDGTTMKGLVVKNKVYAISNIAFVGNGGTAIKHDPEETEKNDVLGSISGCTFQGYTCGVEDVGYGYVRGINSCLFYDCDTGVRMNCQAVGSAVVENDIAYHENWFMNNDTAVSIESLPSGMSAFRTRVHDNTFLFCNREFNMVPTGTFYFLRNYYGGHRRGNESYEAWEHPGNKADEEIRHHARIQADKSKTKTVTNPVRKSINWPCDFWLYAGADQHAAIFTGEKDSILIDGDAFKNPVAAASSDSTSDQELPVSILDQNGNELALWTF